MYRTRSFFCSAWFTTVLVAQASVQSEAQCEALKTRFHKKKVLHLGTRKWSIRLFKEKNEIVPFVCLSGGDMYVIG